MTSRARKILLYTAVIFFIIIAPSLLFYACGYTIDWQNKKPVLTGGFYFKSTPKQAEIYINGKLKGKTSAFIKRALPGEHQVEIKKQGYYPWQKTLKVESQLVTEARNILLIPINPILETIEEKIPKNFSVEDYLLLNNHFSDNFYLQKPSYILYYTDPVNLEKKQINLTPLPDNQDYQIFAYSTEKILLLSDKKDLYLFNSEKRSFEQIANNVQNVQFTNNGQKFLYYTSNEIWTYYLEDILIQPNKRKNEKELITRTSQKIKEAVWYPNTNEHIIFVVNGETKIIELDGRDQRNMIDLFDSGISQITYYSKEEKLYFVKDNKLLRTDLEEE